MAGASCTIHSDVGAVGKCSRCEKPYCLECLDLETGRPLCQNCLAGKPVPAAKADPVAPPPMAPPPPPAPRVTAPMPPPMPASPRIPVSTPPVSKSQDDTFISMDDLNMSMKKPEPPVEEEIEAVPVEMKPEPPVVGEKLKTAPVEIKSEAPKVEMPTMGLPAFKPMDNDPLGLFKNGPAPDMPKIDKPKPAALPFVDLPPIKPIEPKPFDGLPAMSAPVMPQVVSEKTSNSSNFDLAGMMNKLDGAVSASPKITAFDPAALVPAADTVSVRDLHIPKNKWQYQVKSVAGALWLKVDIFAARFKIPGYLLAAIVFVVLVGGLTLVSQLTGGASVVVVDTVTPIHIIQMEVAQISDMDITAFSDLQNHLGALGFNQSLQMTVPQLPSPNFFDVGLKPEEGTYSEILRMPNQIGPRVSFVTVFTNGVWYSTNGWAGNPQQLDYLVSEFLPDHTPEELYNEHLQGVQKLLNINPDWQVQKAGLNRYMAALTDHVRWFLSLKNILPYQADFAAWH
ncbi:MAG TPA: hypothetical protein VK791_05415 [bacterium]|jgi:hypothetical protein|nr:hypothetical protein [bacterium]